ncbi:hypothetical protein [Streptomyces sp. AC627_RSS907]|uniref:hypothetical protein n=1 Tax=Streptomyces sp. AC627_RSS907 TaxID=2823684 RepID=UPI001C273635|nr:hypothetical protein [Streptomyces sp. AC627_RSS907]
MRVRAMSCVTLLGTVVAGPVVAGCGGPSGDDAGADADAVARRARQVAAAWEGSAAADAWRAGYHPMGDVIQLPRGGLRSEADARAYRDRSFVRHGELPATRAGEGRVTWAAGGSLTRPMTGAEDAYRSLSDGRVGDEPHLVVTGAKPGTMTLVTSRGPATVPAWVFTLDGYTSPLKRAAVLPSVLPSPPIAPARDVPVQLLGGLVGVAGDGRSATVVARHGACDDGPAVEVLETPRSVVLSSSVKQRESGGDCTKQAKLQRVTVELARPVGDRVLLDAASGRPIPYTPPHGPSPSWSR